MAAILSWWRRRALREQLLLAILAVLSALFIYWALILTPLFEARAAARANYSAALQQAGSARQVARRLASARQVEHSSDLVTAVRASAADIGLELASSAPSADGVRLRIDAVRPAALFAWLRTLQDELHVHVGRAELLRSDDETIIAEITLARAAAAQAGDRQTGEPPSGAPETGNAN